MIVRTSSSQNNNSPSQQIDAIIKKSNDWRGERLSQLRTLIRKAHSDIIEEVKWKKPSNPMGVPVWSRNGIVCIGETLKNAVRLTFPKGAQLTDPKKLFNTRLDSKTVRAIDFHEGDAIVEVALRALIFEAVELNVAYSSAKNAIDLRSAGPRNMIREQIHGTVYRRTRH